MDRIAMLTEILEGNPEDAFARYGLAMEYAKTDVDRAMQEFQALVLEAPRLHGRLLHGGANLGRCGPGCRSEGNVGQRHRDSEEFREQSRAI